jgi:hypothetical protein
MTQIIDGVMLLLSSSLAASILSKATLSSQRWVSRPRGWPVEAPRHCAMQCWLRR